VNDHFSFASVKKFTEGEDVLNYIQSSNSSPKNSNFYEEIKEFYEIKSNRDKNVSVH
jgi:hypothetical protein